MAPVTSRAIRRSQKLEGNNNLVGWVGWGIIFPPRIKEYGRRIEITHISTTQRHCYWFVEYSSSFIHCEDLVSRGHQSGINWLDMDQALGENRLMMEIWKGYSYPGRWFRERGEKGLEQKSCRIFHLPQFGGCFR